MESDRKINSRSDRLKDWLSYFWPVLAAFGTVKLVQFILYPDPYIMSDTGDYLKSAALLRTNPFKPLGYSIFLAFGRLALPGPLGIPLLQSIVKLSAILMLGNVMKNHYRLPRWLVLAAGLALSLNPTALLFDHYLISDSLFASITIGMIAGLLLFAARKTRPALAIALALALAGAATRYVGLAYPPLVLLFVLLYGRRRLFNAAVVVLAAAALLLGMAVKTHQDLKVFKITMFDGWAFHGTIGHLLIDRPWDLSAIPDDEARLTCGYILTFPLNEFAGRNQDFFRWHPDSPAKKLLSAFLVIEERPDNATARRDSIFLVNFMKMSAKPSTPAQRLFNRFRNKTIPEYPPYVMNYWGAFIVTNELLRKTNREFMKQHKWFYLTEFYPSSLARLFYPNEPPIAQGKYTYRNSADEWVEKFWNGEDTTVWRPRFGDVLGSLNWTHQWFVPAVWLAVLYMMLIAIMGRKALGISVWRMFLQPGGMLLIFGIAFGAAAAFTHMMEVRYTLPIVPFVLVAGTIFGRPEKD